MSTQRSVLGLQMRCVSKWTNTPFKYDKAPETVVYKSGPDAGAVMDDFKNGAVNRFKDTVFGTDDNLRVQKAKEDYVIQELERHEIMHASLVDQHPRHMVLSQVSLWYWPAMVVALAMAYSSMEFLINPQVLLKIQKEEGEKFEAVADKMETFKIDGVVEKIQTIEEELRRRGVKNV
eukprot:TRINITY_DN7545_c0_g1_i1.p1 TRINITY_DN7545_c0_g1~~TRINITY_DN7545_c0_g1_i1.p1  ORF type:complete len:199 (+),score=52.77 TRINITY_DN7545_c0_g1_i1:69-599(+)